MIRGPRSLEAQSWDYAEPKVACVACGKDECGCGNNPEWCRCATVPGVPHAPRWCAFLRAEKPELYGCDSCNALLPSDELSHVRNNSVGEGHFCAACLAPAYAAGRKR